MFDFFRAEPLYHYPMDRFAIISPILYRPEHRVVHVGGGPGRNHPQEINLNLFPLANVDVVANAQRLPFDAGTIDVVISNAVLEHVQDLAATVQEIERVLKPGGFVYVEIPFMQHYHTHDSHGVRFEDYRRLTHTGLAETFGFCTPLDSGVCVGPTSTLCQLAFSYLRELSPRAGYRRLVDLAYHVIGNPLVRIDGWLSDETIRRSAIPSGIYFFGRKRDGQSAALERLPWPNSCFPRELRAEISLVSHTAEQIRVRVRNTGQTTWLRTAELAWGTVHVGVQRVSAGSFELDFRRLELPHDIGAGESFELAVDVASLGNAETVLFDLVIEGLCWLTDRGGRSLSIPLTAQRAGGSH